MLYFKIYKTNRLIYNNINYLIGGHNSICDLLDNTVNLDIQMEQNESSKQNAPLSSDSLKSSKQNAPLSSDSLKSSKQNAPSSLSSLSEEKRKVINLLIQRMKDNLPIALNEIKKKQT